MCIYTCRVIVLGWTSRIACIFSDAPNNLNCYNTLSSILVDKTSFFLKGYNFYVLNGVSRLTERASRKCLIHLYTFDKMLWCAE